MQDEDAGRPYRKFWFSWSTYLASQINVAKHLKTSNLLDHFICHIPSLLSNPSVVLLLWSVLPDSCFNNGFGFCDVLKINIDQKKWFYSSEDWIGIIRKWSDLCWVPSTHLFFLMNPFTNGKYLFELNISI